MAGLAAGVERFFDAAGPGRAAEDALLGEGGRTDAGAAGEVAEWRDGGEGGIEGKIAHEGHFDGALGEVLAEPSLSALEGEAIELGGGEAAEDGAAFGGDTFHEGIDDDAGTAGGAAGAFLAGPGGEAIGIGGGHRDHLAGGGDDSFEIIGRAALGAEPEHDALGPCRAGETNGGAARIGLGGGIGGWFFNVIAWRVVGAHGAVAPPDLDDAILTGGACPRGGGGAGEAALLGGFEDGSAGD